MQPLLQRIVRILLHPKDEWIQTIAEPGDARKLLVPYVVGLAAILPVGQFVATALIGETHVFLGQVSVYRAPTFASLVMSVLLFAALVGVWIVGGLVINLLAPSFGGRPDPEASFKLSTYAMTPVWLAGALSFLATVHSTFHALYVLALVAGTGWGWYLLYTGLPIVMGAPEDKVLGHSIAAAAATIVAAGVAVSVLHGVFGTLLLGSVLPGR